MTDLACCYTFSTFSTEEGDDRFVRGYFEASLPGQEIWPTQSGQETPPTGAGARRGGSESAGNITEIVLRKLQLWLFTPAKCCQVKDTPFAESLGVNIILTLITRKNILLDEFLLLNCSYFPDSFLAMQISANCTHFFKCICVCQCHRIGMRCHIRLSERIAV